jgi:hypothetical protein
MTYVPHTGLLPDIEDDRDFAYRDVLAGDVAPFDWDRGYSVFEELKIPSPKYDQSSSLSCVAQATAQFYRSLFYLFGGERTLTDFSRRLPYSQIRLPGGGAYLRDGVKWFSQNGDVAEDIAPSEGMNEEQMRWADLTQAEYDLLMKHALVFSDSTYRKIDGSVDSIEVFAHAIRNHRGVLGGFKGTNAGWCRPDVVPPKQGEYKWGHAVYLSGAGELDVDLPEIPKGTNCVFTPNSWGGRYTIRSGRWKGLQAIPESYFMAGEQTAAGYVRGIYVTPSWTIVPNAHVPEKVLEKDWLKQREGRLIQLTEEGVEGSGAIGYVKGEEMLVTSDKRAGLLALTLLLREGKGESVNKETWDKIPKRNF